MVVLDNDSFLTALTKFFQQSRTVGTIWLTMKKYNGSTKPKPRKRGKVRAGGSSSEPDEHLCLLRASNGKKHISTVVSAREVTRFQIAYGNLLKGHMDGLKKREKKGTKVTSKRTSSKHKE